jgi:cob(I)alamin adenosyltransferase
MSQFYTRKGDDGTTGLLGEGRVPKDHRRLDAVGTIDEASAALGVARASSKYPQTKEILLRVQRDLYGLMAEVAATPVNATCFRSITTDRVTWLEAQIEQISRIVEIPKEFIIPGDTPAGAALDLARTIVRRAEREVTHLSHNGELENDRLLSYLNRLSSLCFVLELLENHASGQVKPNLAKGEA